MRSRMRLFWQSLFLTLLLVLPLVGTAAFLVQQRSRQEELRRVAAEEPNLKIESGAQSVYRILLAVQQEKPAFVLLRLDAPAHKLTLCGLPSDLQLKAPSGTTTLADCMETAGPARAAQLLCSTVSDADGVTLPELYYLAATPACWAVCAGTETPVRFDTAAVLDADTRSRLGLTETALDLTVAQIGETLREWQNALPDKTAQARVRTALWEAVVRQNPAVLTAFPQALREQSGKTLTSLLAVELAGVEDTLDYLTEQPDFATDYCTVSSEILTVDDVKMLTEMMG